MQASDTDSCSGVPHQQADPLTLYIRITSWMYDLLVDVELSEQSSGVPHQHAVLLAHPVQGDGW